MTRDEREKLKALAEKATPGPWHVNRGDVLSSQSHPLATLSDPSHRQMLTPRGKIVTGLDAEFIAASRAAVPSLLLDLETAEGLLRRAVEKNGPRAHADLCGVVSGLSCDCWLGAARAFLGEQP